MALSKSERSGEPMPRLSARVEDVELTLDPPLLRVDLQGEVLGVSPGRIDPLRHRPRDRAAFTVVLQSHSDEPRLVTLRNATIDGRFDPAWCRWSFAPRKRDETQGGAAAEAQDVAGENRLTLLLTEKESRRARLEFDVPLTRGVVPARILLRLNVECRDACTELTSVLMVQHPDSDLLARLPGLYEEAMAETRKGTTPPDAPFFERYLVGFEDALDPLRESLGRTDALFGPYSAPSDFLGWLAGWVCMPLDGNWPEMKRRRLVAEAVELFRWRGTRRGLSRMLEIYTGVAPTIHDQPRAGASLGPGTRMGAPDAIVGDVPEHTFTVALGVPDPDALSERAIRRIIESQKPAHAAYRLVIVEKDASRGPAEPEEAVLPVPRHPWFGPDERGWRKPDPRPLTNVPRHPLFQHFD